MAAERNDDLFPELEPPPGGTTRLMARIEADDRARRRRGRWVAGVAGLAMAATVVAVAVLPGRVVPQPRIDPAWREAPGMVALGLGTPPKEPVEIAGERRGRMAAERVPTGDPSVVFYLVGSTAQ